MDDFNEVKQGAGRHLIRNMLLVGLLALLLTSAAVAAVTQIEAKAIEDVLPDEIDPGLVEELTPAESGKAQTILLVGDDHRFKNRNDPLADGSSRADTMILVRLDPEGEATSMLAFPRDLHVPGVVGKLNATFNSGPSNLIRTLKKVLSTPEDPFVINHYASVRFTGFSQAVNFLGCFYVDVDRRYYVPEEAEHAAIDLKAGYQQLCGEDSLSFVRFREDSDYVRGARQSSFISDARSQISSSKLIEDRVEFIRSIREYIRTDIRKADGLLGVMQTALAVSDKPVQRFRVKASSETGPERDPVASQKDLEQSVRKFMNPPAVEGKEFRATKAAAANGQTTSTTTSTAGKSSGSVLSPSAKSKKAKAAANKRPRTIVPAGPASLQEAKKVSSMLDNLPVFYPQSAVNKGGFKYDTISTRAYDVGVNRNQKYPYQAYRIVVKLPSVSGGYYGVQGVAWDNPPILSLADNKEQLGGRTFFVQYNAKKIHRLIWQSNGNTYWITNTISDDLSNPEMRWLAKSIKSIPAAGSGN